MIGICRLTSILVLRAFLEIRSRSVLLLDDSVSTTVVDGDAFNTTSIFDQGLPGEAPMMEDELPPPYPGRPLRTSPSTLANADVEQNMSSELYVS